jgi:uncharacterized protein YebE (UPF0316 family)
MIQLAIFIFFARICDVSLGTLRIIFVSKGYKTWAACIAFVELMIWIIVISKVIHNLDHWLTYVAYAGGFASGNYIGMVIEEHLTLGHELIRIITKKSPDQLLQHLKNEGYGITSLKGNGINGEVGVVYVIIKRNRINQIKEIIKEYNPQALYTIEDIRFVSKKIFFRESPKRKFRNLHIKK